MISSTQFEGDSLKKLAILNHVTGAAAPNFSVTHSGVFNPYADLTPYQEEMAKFRGLKNSLASSIGEEVANAAIATLLTKNNLELMQEITEVRTHIRQRFARDPHGFPSENVLRAAVIPEEKVKFSYLSHNEREILQEKMEEFFDSSLARPEPTPRNSSAKRNYSGISNSK